jgi:uncharacterized membrane protein
MRRRLRPVVIAVGVMLTLTGLLWIGQGLGYVQWPRSSFMLEQRVWADYGAALAVVGLVMVLLGRRMR